MIMDTSKTKRRKLPNFSFTGEYKIEDEGSGNWHISFLSSGTLTVKSPGSGKISDIYLNGAGGDGAGTIGGRGGYRKTHLAVEMLPGIYQIQIGEKNGAETAIRKNGAPWLSCADEGCVWARQAFQGSNGNPGGHAFDDSEFPMYGGGGGAGPDEGTYATHHGGDGGGGNGGSQAGQSYSGENGEKNKGAGGGGAYVGIEGAGTPGRGSSGVLIWRNDREAKAA